MSLKKDDLDYIIRDALHGMVDNLEVHERVKKKLTGKLPKGWARVVYLISKA